MRSTFRLCRILAIVSGVCAGSVEAAGPGTTGAAFLKVGVGARPLGMGSAFTAMADDANAINWNPGAIGIVQQKHLTLSYNSLFKDQNQGFLGFVSPLGEEKGGFGIGVNYLTISNIEKRARDTEDPDSTFDNQNFALIGSYGKSGLSEGLSVGGNLKYIRESLDNFSGNAVAIDLGALYKTRVQDLTAGFAIQNIGTKIGPDPLPLEFRGGLAYKMLEQRLAVAADLDWLALDARLYGNLGLEGWANQVLAARVGYQAGRARDRLGSSLVGFTFGVGFRLQRARIDYAFLPFGDLGDTHRITLGWSF